MTGIRRPATPLSPSSTLPPATPTTCTRFVPGSQDVLAGFVVLAGFRPAPWAGVLAAGFLIGRDQHRALFPLSLHAFAINRSPSARRIRLFDKKKMRRPMLGGGWGVGGGGKRQATGSPQSRWLFQGSLSRASLCH